MCEGALITHNNIFARELAWRLFRDAADQDYLVARWAASVGLSHQFFWSAEQAIEKYLKCALLQNGHKVASSNHDIIALFNTASNISGNLLPTELNLPKEFDGPDSVSFLLKDFVADVCDQGSPNVRYRQIGVTLEGQDLHKIDEACFKFRRICFPLDLQYGNLPKTFRNILESDRRHHPHPMMSFERVGTMQQVQERLRIFKWRNFSYFEDTALELGEINAGFQVHRTPWNSFLDKSKESREAIRWILKSAKFDIAVKAELEKYL